jgi:hypothetical protein
VSLPDDLLAQLDAEVKRRSTSRSAVLSITARRELARHDPGDLAAAIERSERRCRAAGSFESADLVKSDAKLVGDPSAHRLVGVDQVVSRRRGE